MAKIQIVPSARTRRATAELADAMTSVPINGATPDEQLAQRVQAIKTLGKRTIQNIIEIGYHLTDAKALCIALYGHGRWLALLKLEFGWSDKTAEQFMNVYEVRGEIENFSNSALPVSAFYLLARPSTPKAVRQEVTERVVGRGEKLSVEEVKETISKARAELVPDKFEAKPPSYTPDDVIDEIIDLFKALAHNDQTRCLRMQHPAGPMLIVDQSLVLWAATRQRTEQNRMVERCALIGLPHVARAAARAKRWNREL